MSYRISLYCVPKMVVNKYREYKEEDYKNDDKFFDDLEKNEVKSDTLTDVISSDKDNSFSTPLFKNRLSIEDDMYFGTISKEQLLNIIEEVRSNHICKWFSGRVVTDDKVGESFQKPMGWHMKDAPWTPEKGNEGESR